MSTSSSPRAERSSASATWTMPSGSQAPEPVGVLGSAAPRRGRGRGRPSEARRLASATSERTGVLALPGHRGDGDGVVDPLAHEQRGDQVVDAEPGLGHQAAQGRGAARAGAGVGPGSPLGPAYGRRLTAGARRRSPVGPTTRRDQGLHEGRLGGARDSTATARPARRAAAAVIGPMQATTGGTASGRPRRRRQELQAATVDGDGEGDGVGPGERRPPTGVGGRRRGDGAVGDRPRRPRQPLAAQPVGERGAGGGGPREEHPPRPPGRPAKAAARPGAGRLVGDQVGHQVVAARAPAVAAADRRPGGPGRSARPSRSSGHEAVDGVGRGEDDPVVGGHAGPPPRAAPRRRPSGSAISIAGSSITAAPAASSRRRGRRPACRRPGSRRPSRRPAGASAGRQVEGGHRADHDHRRASRARPTPSAPRVVRTAALGGRGPPLDDGHRGVGRPPAGLQPPGDLGPGGHAHEDDEGPAGPGQRLPVDAAGGGGVADVAGHHRDRGRQAPVGDRHPGVGRARRRPRSPRAPPRRATPAAGRASASSPPRPKRKGSPPFSRTTVRPARPCATSSALISSWRAAPVPATAPPGARPGRALAHVDQHGAGRGQGEQRAVDQPVVDDDVGPGQQLGAPPGEQPGVARARPRPGRRSPRRARRRGRRRPPSRGPSRPHASSSGPASCRPRASGSSPARSARTTIRPSPLATMPRRRSCSPSAARGPAGHRQRAAARRAPARNARSADTAPVGGRSSTAARSGGRAVVVGPALDGQRPLADLGQHDRDGPAPRRPGPASRAARGRPRPPPRRRPMPSSARRSRVAMLPRSSTKVRSGRRLASWARRRAEPVATGAPGRQVGQAPTDQGVAGIGPLGHRRQRRARRG